MPLSPRHTSRERVVLALLAPALGLLLSVSACSSSGSSSAGAGAAGSAESGPSTGGSSGSGSASDAELSAARDAYDLRLAECIRSRGVEVADPEPGEGITESGAEVQAASAACIETLGEPPVRALSKQDMAEIDRQYLATAACLRDLGYDVADPPQGEALAVEDVPPADFATCSKAS